MLSETREQKGYKVVAVKVNGEWLESMEGKRFDILPNFEDWTNDFVGKVEKIKDSTAPKNTVVYKVGNRAKTTVALQKTG